MRLRVLGCYGGELLGYKSTALLIDDHLLIDAGNVSILTSADDLSRIRHLVLSHAHLDHIKALPFVAEQLAEGGTGLDVYGTDEVIGKYTEVYCGNLLCYGIDHIDRTKIKGSGGKEESASEPPSLGYLNFVPAV